VSRFMLLLYLRHDLMNVLRNKRTWLAGNCAVSVSKCRAAERVAGTSATAGSSTGRRQQCQRE
jgi:hypothetical protein